MATKLDVSIVLSGQSFILNNTNTYNIEDVIGVFGNLPCSFVLTYNGTEYIGTGMRAHNEIIVTFDDPVVLPKDTCMLFTCPKEMIEENDCRDLEIPYDNDLRLAVLDNDGCLIGWIKLKDACKEGDGSFTLCELLGIDKIPDGAVTMADRVLVVNDNCELKSVPLDDISCHYRQNT